MTGDDDRVSGEEEEEEEGAGSSVSVDSAERGAQ